MKPARETEKAAAKKKAADKEITNYSKRISARRGDLTETALAEKEKRAEIEKTLAALWEEAAESEANRDLARANVAELKKKLNELRVAERDHREITKKELIELAEKKKEQLADEKKDRLGFMEDMRIEASRRGKDELATSRLEAAKMLREKKEEIDKRFALSEELSEGERKLLERQRKEAIQLAEEEAKAHVKAAVDKARGVKEKTLNVAKREEDLERSITSELIKRVQTLRDVFMLYQAIATIRQIQENRARIAADQAIMAEHRLAKMRERREGMKEGSTAAERMDLALQRAEAQVRISQMVAGKRAGEAQLPGAQQVQDMMMGTAAQMQEQMLGIHQSIVGIFQNIGNAFETAPVLWVEAFVVSWQIESQRMINEVRATMSQLSAIMLPTATHSPSLLQVMDMNVAAVSKGISRVAGALEQAVPRLRNASVSRALAVQGGRFGAVAGFEPQPSIQTLHDNRRVEMNLNNNLDLDDVDRRIGNAITRAGMRGGGM